MINHQFVSIYRIHDKICKLLNLLKEVSILSKVFEAPEVDNARRALQVRQIIKVNFAMHLYVLIKKKKKCVAIKIITYY